jgi:hypothetical protein
MILRLSETNDNFNEKKFRNELWKADIDKNARLTTKLFSSPLTENRRQI